MIWFVVLINFHTGAYGTNLEFGYDSLETCERKVEYLQHQTVELEGHWYLECKQGTPRET